VTTDIQPISTYSTLDLSTKIQYPISDNHIAHHNNRHILFRSDTTQIMIYYLTQPTHPPSVKPEPTSVLTEIGRAEPPSSLPYERKPEPTSVFLSFRKPEPTSVFLHIGKPEQTSVFPLIGRPETVRPLFAPPVPVVALAVAAFRSLVALAPSAPSLLPIGCGFFWPPLAALGFVRRWLSPALSLTRSLLSLLACSSPCFAGCVGRARP